MGILSRKVVNATRLARQAEDLVNIKFEVTAGAVNFITFGGKNITSFDSATDANKFAKDLNDALTPVIKSISDYYEKKVSDILNA